MTESKNKIHRVQIDFSEEAYQSLLDLQRSAGNATVTSLVRDALGLYTWHIEQKNQNAEFFVRNGDEVERIVFDSSGDRKV